MNLSASIDIDRPSEEVFDYVKDVGHDVEWRTGVVEASVTSDGEPGVGSTGFDRIDNKGRKMVSEWKVVEWVPGSHFRWDLTSGPIKGIGGYICEPAGDRTRFTLEANVTPRGWFRLLGPIFGMIGRRQNQSDVAKLKQILEGSEASG
ncbi:MAG: SRPBCC family protein [Acidimicrobiia bacterium]|nr:SRPBCC family protein [Acidimicrobiia bacterium]